MQFFFCFLCIREQVGTYSNLWNYSWCWI